MRFLAAQEARALMPELPPERQEELMRPFEQSIRHAAKKGHESVKVGVRNDGMLDMEFRFIRETLEKAGYGVSVSQITSSEVCCTVSWRP